jgi:hypothetical protein
MKPYKIIYIAGNGRSGSTLLDIVLGSHPDAFSAGELTFIGRVGIKDELCSCGERIGACPFWTEVMAAWRKRGVPDPETYRKLRWRFERNKASLRTLVRSTVRPSPLYRDYCAATEALFDALHEVSGAPIIIDSSKTPARIPVLRSFGDVRVLHLCRRFTGVLNSSQRGFEKDLDAGVEEDIPPRATRKVLADWVLNNLLTEMFAAGTDRHRVLYRRFVQAPEEAVALLGVPPEGLERRTFSAEHMLAGNRMRLKPSITVDGNVGFKRDQLSQFQASLATGVDLVFARWSGDARTCGGSPASAGRDGCSGDAGRRARG